MLSKTFLFRCAALVADVYGKNFSVSCNAWKRISEVNKNEGFSNSDRLLRLAIESGGCHGYLYKFSFENLNKFDPEEDIKLTSAECGVPTAEVSDSELPPQFALDKHSLSKLQNATIDFHSELKGSAFVVVGNELVDQSCACAMSFSIRKNKKDNPSVSSPFQSVAASKAKPISRVKNINH